MIFECHNFTKNSPLYLASMKIYNFVVLDDKC